MKVSRHSLILAGILLLGTILRFWNLDSKPVWLDEVITALFSLGRTYNDVPLNQVFPVSALEQVFTLQPQTTCAQIVKTVSTQSVHPPLFFCWMHNWMNWTQFWPQSWLWKLRALPALIGVVAIGALYQLNRIAFSPKAGLVGAAAMAVSPFAVYLSQEARHYTLPMLLVTLALLGLYKILIDLSQQQWHPSAWLGWIAVNSLGFYVHYFFVLAFVAQVATLIVCAARIQKPWLAVAKTEPEVQEHEPSGRRQPFPERGWQSWAAKLHFLTPLYPGSPRLRFWQPIALSIMAVCLAYLPWLPTMLSHLTRPETDWLQTGQSDWHAAIAPLYQLVIGWILMVIALPVERQLTWIEIADGVLMLLFAGWLAWWIWPRIQRLWQAPETHLATQMLGFYVLAVLLEFLAIVYVLGKDITQVPRYNFIYFPAVSALLGAGLITKGRFKSKQKRLQILKARIQQPRWSRRRRKTPALLIPQARMVWIVVCVGILSSALVVSDFVFQKPYEPDRVARNMLVNPELPLLTAVGYSDFQDVALGLSFALALQEQHLNAPAGSPAIDFVFLQHPKSYQRVWKSLSQLKHSLPLPLNLWVVAPGLRRKDFPQHLTFAEPKQTQGNCTIDPPFYHRRGIPYQLYRCR